MSLLPFILGYEAPRRRHWPSRLLDQEFGLALTPNDLLLSAGPMLSEDYYRPWRQLAAATRDVGSSIKADKEKFQVNLDVQHFSPEELSVKTADGYIVVEGKHEEKKDDHGYISRQFTRRYALPEGCVPETVESRLSSDGVLSITAPRKVPEAIRGERSVPIAQTGPVRKEIKDHQSQTLPEGSVHSQTQSEASGNTQAQSESRPNQTQPGARVSIQTQSESSVNGHAK